MVIQCSLDYNNKISKAYYTTKEVITMPKIGFPRDFIWGAATAAYQIEGAYNQDGKGESIWDRFCHTPGNVENGDTGDIACDHYNRLEEDIRLMKELGIKSYRYSISWPRILPEGKGKLNQRGMDFYKRLTNLLLENEIEPLITLYHWDLPQKLQDIGGWANRDVTDYFTNYAEVVFNNLGDIVPYWVTINEPWVVAFLGNMFGSHAPGIKDLKTALDVSHNLMLSHGKAVKLYREMNQKGKISIALNFSTKYPASQKEEDIKAARLSDGGLNRWFLDPIFKGYYPEDVLELYSKRGVTHTFPMEDLKVISQPMDFLAFNYYSSEFVKHDPDIGFSGINNELDSFEKTEMGWIVYPQGLYDLITRLGRDYGKIDLIISENGAAFKDFINSDGTIDDHRRTNYIKEHLTQVHRAIESGINLKGYYLWSLMDNFEWAFGYSKRFGLIHVDYETLKRTIKNSGHWYKEVIRNNGF